MKCPMSNYVMERESGEDEVLLNDCFKEECAWWVETQAECAIKQLSLSLGYISLDTTQLLEKTLQEGKK